MIFFHYRVVYRVVDTNAVTMTTSSVVLQLAVMLTVTMATTQAGRTFRLHKIGQRVGDDINGETPALFKTVLDRINQLAALVIDIQASVEEMHETVNHINATVNFPVTSQFLTLYFTSLA